MNRDLLHRTPNSTEKCFTKLVMIFRAVSWECSLHEVHVLQNRIYLFDYDLLCSCSILLI